jgi:hypothetical protein
MTFVDHDSFSQSILRDFPSLNEKQREHLAACEDCMLAIIKRRDLQKTDDRLELDADATRILERSRRRFATGIHSRKRKAIPAKAIAWIAKASRMENLPPELPEPTPAELSAWIEEFEAAARRPLTLRMKYAFIRTYNPVLDDAPYRSFESMEEYRQWCEKNLPSWLGYGRVWIPTGAGTSEPRGASMPYKFRELGDASCRDVARSQSELLFGRIAANTAFDSGLLSIPDWQQINGYCISPAITQNFIDTWPVSHDEYCDEWWVFDAIVPLDFRVHSFCNFINQRIADYKELDYEQGCPLDHYLEKFRPVAIFGNNEMAYLITREW